MMCGLMMKQERLKIFDKFEQKLESNQSVILELINQRFMLLSKEIELKRIKNNALK